NGISLVKRIVNTAGQLDTTVLAARPNAPYSTTNYVQWRIVRDARSGLIQVFENTQFNEDVADIPVLEATDSTLQGLGYFIWEQDFVDRRTEAEGNDGYIPNDPRPKTKIDFFRAYLLLR